ncbi:MAG: tRNA pseudouridine(38-40) synthase TruA [Firmicutes bacterium]|nr:tRNA pseudouridine(38-40) synthase TruA [Bacillota bacterium]
MKKSEFNHKMVISFDGTGYAGFQIQPKQKTVQGVLETVLETVCQQKVTVVASGRTDSGVHAKKQTVNFFTSNKINCGHAKTSLNQMLPPDIRVLSVEEADKEFSARYSAKAKTYSYTIWNGDVLCPFERDTAMHIKRPLDIEKMKEASASLIGYKNFKSFCKTGAAVTDHMRKLTDIRFETGSHGDATPTIIKIYFTGRSFLHNQVRIMTQALVDVGLGKLTKEDIENALKKESRTNGIGTADAKGLCLEEVLY